MTLLLSNEDVEAALSMTDCLEALELAYRDLGQKQGGNGVRSELLTPTVREDAVYSLLTMSGVNPGFGIGAVRINSDILTWPESESGPRRTKVPAAPDSRYTGLVLLFSTASGEPLAIYPDGVAQRMRVAGTSGLAAKYLSRANARDVALLGTGWQAGGQAMAIAEIRSIQRIRCYSPKAERREGFACETAAKLGIECIAVGSAREAVSGADVVLLATNSLQPVFAADWLEPGMHVSSLSRLELDAKVADSADVVFTHIRETENRILRTAGADLGSDAERRKNALSRDIGQSARPELSDLLLGRVPGRRNEREITLFLNYSGLGYQFAATGHVIYTKARELGLGRELDTNLFTSAVPS
ncbi:MAG TPA: ornithine cyclodeaminase family protein [Micropepsaceae bacterium]|nr:ornithine cyclodeaminase family protein [Micropepsaceae bacterium]